MAVEVTSWGSLPETRPLVGRCGHCGSTVRCDAKDARIVDQRDTVPVVECPLCKHYIEVRSP